MSFILHRGIHRTSGYLIGNGIKCNNNCLKFYSRRSKTKNLERSFKVVTRRDQDRSDFLGIECGPNWELLAPRGNRFFFPGALGPAWQGVNSTLTLDAPLESLVNFEEKNADTNSNNDLLQIHVHTCPSLIKKNLHELFPAPEVVTSDKMALVTLRYDGDNELGARKFVMAAREITTRLRLHGYWADFMNPFSGKPFYSWSNSKNLYKIDDRFRGLNMKVTSLSNCTVISTDETGAFSGSIYTNAPSDYSELKLLIEKQV